MSEKYEKVEQPQHYQGKGGMTVMQIIRAYECNFAVGNVIKYMLRAGKKPDEDCMEDLQKALWYLKEEIDRITPEENRVIGANLGGKSPSLQGFEDMGRHLSASYPPGVDAYKRHDPSFANPHLDTQGVRSIIDLSKLVDDQDED